ncbi:uncharacterized protein [Drosophila bipectinata]|uniref:uncharacterized protein isoform X2 n=1 Tax=Drosophila bipectinata TaxID=42026 RepID=UPI001C89C64D|nr:uncharacterized protein LOC108130400 isoform X2 [Drosophila bipectinata]
MDNLWNTKSVSSDIPKGSSDAPVSNSNGNVAQLVEQEDSSQVNTSLPAPLLQTVEVSNTGSGAAPMAIPNQIAPIRVDGPSNLSPFMVSLLHRPSALSPSPLSPYSPTDTEWSLSSNFGSPSESSSIISLTTSSRLSTSISSLASPTPSMLSTSSYDVDECVGYLSGDEWEMGLPSWEIAELDRLEEPAEQVIRDVIVWAQNPYQEVQMTDEAENDQNIRKDALEKIVKRL